MHLAGTEMNENLKKFRFSTEIWNVSEKGFEEAP